MKAHSVAIKDFSRVSTEFGAELNILLIEGNRITVLRSELKDFAAKVRKEALQEALDSVPPLLTLKALGQARANIAALLDKG